MLGREEGFGCEICVDGAQLDQVSEFKYLGCVLNESGRNGAECYRKIMSRRKVAETIKALFKLGVCSLNVQEY